MSGANYFKLNPADDAIKNDFKKWKESMEERAFMAKSNALALAGALDDDENGDDQRQQVADTGEVKVCCM